MDNYKWTAYFNIEIVNSKCVPQIFERSFKLNEDDGQYLAYKLAVDEGERIINAMIPGGWISKIELI